MRTPRAIVATTLSLLVLAACNDTPDEPDDPADQAGDPAQDAEEHRRQQEALDPLRDVTPADVELIDEGAEPRHTLRLDLEEGTEVTGILAFEEEELGASAAEEEEPLPPEVEIELRVEVTDVDDGRATIAFVYEDIDIGGPLPDAPHPLDETRGELVVDERSRLVATTDRAQGVDQLPIALPQEEVGEGATWQIRTEGIFGLPATEVMTVELISVDDEGYELELNAQTEGPDEPTPLSGDEDADVVVLTELERDSEGRQEASTSSPFPIGSTLTTHTVLVMELAGGGPDAEGEEQQEERLRENVTFEQH